MSQPAADVLVLGAGIIGCTVGESLIRGGRRVAFIDPRGVGRGATHASAGMLTPFSEGRHVPALETLGTRSLQLYDEFVARVAARLDLPPVYARTGSLDVALDDDEAADLEERARADRARGIESTLLSQADVRKLERDVTPDCRAGLYTPSHGYASALDLTAALWRACESAGATLTHDVVERIAPEPGGGVRVVTGSQTFTAPIAVLAAGSWAGEVRLDGGDSVPVRPIRGQLLQLALDDASISRIVWSTSCYTVPWPDGTLLVGATLEDVGFDDRATVAGVRDLLDAVCEMIPRAWHAQFVRVRVGLRPSTPDALPIIGASERIPGLVYATGHYRNGVLLAPLTGELVSAIVDGRDDPALALTAPSRFGDF